MSDSTEFDIKAAKAELAELRQRGRELEAAIAKELRRRLKALSRVTYEAQDVEALLSDARRMVDAE